MESKMNLAQMQMAELEMIKLVHQICEKNNLKYYLVYGTLLGAVRHNGFIPWDHDADLAMFRDDYEKFLSICQCELPDEYFLQTEDTEEGYILPICRICMNSTYLKTNIKNRHPIHTGHQLDIFPIDNVPDNALLSKFQQCYINNITKLLTLKIYEINTENIGIRKWRNAVKVAAGELMKPFSLSKLKYLRKKSMTKYNNFLTDEVTAWGPYGKSKEQMKKNWFGKGTEINFEMEKFYAVDNSHAYLKQVYGNYMVPPSNEKIQMILEHLPNIYMKK